ncbi:hypothetical protein [Catellatospora sichuanensis]|uniref:hypothetical protein n=1 Tax=Catellatospora sichuanensis TaxID=1969805 RepID=UPI001182AC93|nr:hypothetical protein [Catellatospora sichuanensis]
MTARTFPPERPGLLIPDYGISNGKSGAARTGQPWNVYRWTPGVDQPTSVVKGLGDPLAAAATPDDRSLLVSTLWKSQYGILRVDLQSGEMALVTAGRSPGVSISPDGKKIAAVLQPAKGSDYDIEHTELRVIDAGRAALRSLPRSPPTDGTPAAFPRCACCCAAGERRIPPAVACLAHGQPVDDPRIHGGAQPTGPAAS